MRTWLAFALCLAAAACGYETSGTDDFGVVKRIVVGKLTAAKAPAGDSALAGLDRARIDSIGLPLLQVTVENRGAVAVLGLLAQGNGVQTWTTADSITLSLRDGVVSASRGLGDDLMSAAVPSAATLARGTGVVERRHYGLYGGEIEIAAPFRCTLASQGRETLTVYDLGYPVTRVTESCEGSAEGVATRFVNEYWFEGSGKIRQSRQWLGGNVGFLKLTQINR